MQTRGIEMRAPSIYSVAGIVCHHILYVLRLLSPAPRFPCNRKDVGRVVRALLAPLAFYDLLGTYLRWLKLDLRIHQVPSRHSKIISLSYGDPGARYGLLLLTLLRWTPEKRTVVRGV